MFNPDANGRSFSRLIPRPEPGAEIHGHILMERLGEGVFGETWLAENLDRERFVLKFLASDAGPEALDAARRAAARYRRMRAALEDGEARPPLAALKQSFLNTALPALAFERVAGANLARFRRDRGFQPMDFWQSLEIVRDILRALGFAHSQGVEHLGLTPRNVLFDPAAGGRWKVTDFGLAAARAGQSTTRSGDAAAYLAPERRRGAIEDPEASEDIYSLGALWAETLCGGEAPGAPLDWAKRVPAEAVPFLAGCLDSDPTLRWSSRDLLREVRAKLDARLRETLPETPAPAEAPEKRESLFASLKEALSLKKSGELRVLKPAESEKPELSSAPKKSSEAAGNNAFASDDESIFSKAGGDLGSAKSSHSNPKAQKLFETAEAYYFGREERLKNFVKAAKLYQKAAQLGHAEAMFSLGVLHFLGEGVERSDETAAHWWRQAAQAGSPKAATNLGILTALGRGAELNDEAALAWLRRGAAGGCARAMTKLGDFCAQGRGGPQDLPRAAEWYRQAADAGDGEGAYRLAQCYEKGRGVELNKEEAIRWHRAAIGMGFDRARAGLARVMR
jgi:TPR repeat protein